MNATYTKLRSGEWGVRVEGTAAKGQTLTVVKKSGETKQETVRNVVWSGNGITICAIARSEPSYDRSVERLYRNKYGWDGVRGSSSYYTSGMYDEES